MAGQQPGTSAARGKALVTRQLDALRKASQGARDATEHRNELIRKLRYEGEVPLRTIAEAAGLTHTAIAKVAPLPRPMPNKRSRR